ncbi:MAG: hypothetical protein ACI4RA_08335 [Kiritimatiellia bacterium]
MDKVRLRLKALVVLIGLFVAAALVAEDFPRATTNDVDAVFHAAAIASFFMRDGSFELCRRISAHASDPEARAVGRYLLARLVEFPVSTNSPFAMLYLRDKSWAVSDAVMVLAGMMEESDVRWALDRSMVLAAYPTNHFESLLQAARERDAALPPPPLGQRMVFGDNPPSNVGAVRREMLRVERWNTAVEVYRNEIGGAVARVLADRWKDLPEEIRRAHVAEVLKPYGIRMRR